MRRIAILTLSIFAALPAFSQKAAKGAKGATGATAAAPAAPTGPHPKSAAEATALNALLNAVNDEDQATSTAARATAADVAIKDANDLLTTYPDTDYKAMVEMREAQGYHYKSDDPKAIVLGEQSLEGDPNNYETLLLMAEIYSRSTRATDLDKDDKLAKVDKYAKQALDLVAKAPKPNPGIPDADWANHMSDEKRQAYLSLGYAGIVAGKANDADAYFQKAADIFPDPYEMLRIDRSYAIAKNYDESIKWADKAVAVPNAPDQAKTYAAEDKTRAEKMKKQ